MKPIVYLYQCKFAEDTEGAAAIMDNARMSGAESVHARWDKDAEVWKVEYQVPRDKNDD